MTPCGSRSAARFARQRAQHCAPPQANDHIWITDDALQHAYNRFATVSLLCKTQRRFGSNVPGPLEARRRLAKRRMAIVSPQIPYDDTPVWTMWAGMRSWLKSAATCLGPERYPWDSLEWEPPWTTRQMQLSTPSNTPNLESDSLSTGPPQSQTIDKASDTPSLADKYARFEALVGQCETVQALDCVDMGSPSERMARRKYASILLDRLFACQMFWSQREDADWAKTLRSMLYRIFRTMSGDLTNDKVTTLTHRLIDIAQDPNQLQSLLPLWYSALRFVDVRRNFTFDFEAAMVEALRSNRGNSICPSLTDIATPSTLAHCFTQFNDVALGRVLIVCALSRAQRFPTHRALALVLYSRYTRKSSKSTLEDVVKVLGKCGESMVSARHRQRLWAWLYIFVYELKGEAELLRLLSYCRRNNLTWGRTEAAMARLLHVLAKTDPEAAVRIFKGSMVRVARLQPIVSTLMESGRVSHNDIVFIMWHGQDPNRVWSSFSNPTRRLTRERVDLINEMALKFASQEHVSARMAFRNVSHCWHYLQDAGEPITKEIVEALILSGVTRTLQSQEWLSTTQFAWILDRVKEVEGPDSAQKLDRMTFSWREQVRRHLMDKRRERYDGGEKAVSFTRWMKVPRRKYGLTRRERTPRKTWQRKEQYRTVNSPKITWIARDP